MQVELDGVSFDNFQIPSCPGCQRDGIVETNVRILGGHTGVNAEACDR